MKLSKKNYYNIASVIPTRLLKRSLFGSTLLPYHHLVSNEDVLHVKHLYSYKNVSQFKSDLEYLLKHFRPVAVSEIADTLCTGKKIPGNSFLLSFDDGYSEVYNIIAPILYDKGVPAVFFINPAFLDNNKLFYRCKISLIIEKLFVNKNENHLLNDCLEVFGNIPFESLEKLIALVRTLTNQNESLLDKLAMKLDLSFDEYLREQTPFLSSNQVRELAQKGFSIGAHSWDHPYYSLISPEEQQKQTIDSCLYIKEKFSPPLNLFSFPHSDKQITQTFFDRMGLSGTSVDIFFGTQNQKLELYNKVLHRFNAERPDFPINKQLNGVLLLMFLQRFLKLNKVIRKL